MKRCASWAWADVAVLPVPISLSEMLRSEWRKQATLRRLIRECAPDVIYVFSLYGVSHGLMLAAQRTGRPVVYAFSGEWLKPRTGVTRGFSCGRTGRIWE